MSLPFPSTAGAGHQELITEIVLPGIVDPEALDVTTRAMAAPGPGQVRLRMEASGVSFAEQQMRRGKY